MTTTNPTRVPVDAGHRRRSVRLLAAAVSAVIAVTYVVLLFLVRDAEASAHVVTDTTWGGYLFLAVPYVIGAVLLLVTDRRALWVVGAVVQVLVLVAFVVLALGVGLGPDNTGVFTYDALDDLPMELFAAVVTGLELVLLTLLVSLSRAGRPHAVR